jgi:hypothetical protein
MILKIFSPKHLEEKKAILTQHRLFCAEKSSQQ